MQGNHYWNYKDSKESIFSDLNNLDVVTTTSDEYADSFGFTQDEMSVSLDKMGLVSVLLNFMRTNCGRFRRKSEE